MNEKGLAANFDILKPNTLSAGERRGDQPLLLLLFFQYVEAAANAQINNNNANKQITFVYLIELNFF
jgi:hypothetical protein